MSKYIEFKEVDYCDEGVVDTPYGKTKVWDVVEKAGRFTPGEVSWYSLWDKYVFMPEKSEMTIDEACLRDIADFIEEQTKLHKGK